MKAVVLDEIHLLDRTPRGDQLRILLERLRRINNVLNYYALSATIDHTTIGDRYFAGAKTTIHKNEREIEYLLLKKKMTSLKTFSILFASAVSKKCWSFLTAAVTWKHTVKILTGHRFETRS